MILCKINVSTQNFITFLNNIYMLLSHRGNKKKPADICESNEQPNVEPIHIEHDEKNAVGTELETETCKPQENPHKQDEKRENGMNGNHFLERNVDTTRL